MSIQPTTTPGVIQPVNPYEGIAWWVRSRLLTTATQMPTESISTDIQSVVNRLALYYPVLPPYSQLQGSDLAFFNEAAGLMVAARLRIFNPKTSATHELTRYTNGPTTFQYQPPRTGLGEGQKGPKTVEEQWIDDAYTALRLVSSIAAFYASFQANFQVFALAGLRREAMRLGLLPLHRYCGGYSNPLWPLTCLEDEAMLRLVDNHGQQS